MSDYVFQALDILFRKYPQPKVEKNDGKKSENEDKVENKEKNKVVKKDKEKSKGEEEMKEEDHDDEKEKKLTLNEDLEKRITEYKVFSKLYMGVVFPITNDNLYFETYDKVNDTKWNFVLANLDLLKCAAETINRDNNMLSFKQRKLLILSSQAVVKFAVDAYLPNGLVPKSFSQLKNEFKCVPTSVDEWASYDERLYLVVQALFYIVELIGQRIRSKGPYLTRSTLRRRDLHSKGAKKTGILESNADTSHRRGTESLPSIVEDAEFGIRMSGESLEEFEKDCGQGHIVAAGDFDVPQINAGKKRESLTDKSTVESALQSYADLLMDETFLSVFVAFVHLKRVNNFLNDSGFLKLKMDKRIAWCSKHFKPFNDMRCLALIFMDLVMLQAYIEMEVGSDISKMKKKKFLRKAVLETLSDSLLSSPKGLAIAIRSLMSTDNLTDYDEIQKVEAVSIIIVTILQYYINKEYTVNFLQTLCVNLLHSGAEFLRHASASIILRLIKRDDIFTNLLKSFVFGDSLKTIHNCRDIELGVSLGMTYPLETLYFLFCKRGDYICPDQLFISTMSNIVDVIFHIGCNINTLFWRPKIVKLISRYLEALNPDVRLDLLKLFMCVKFTKPFQRQFADNLNRLVIIEQQSSRKVYQDQIHGYDFEVSMRPEMLNCNEIVQMNDPLVISVSRMVLDILAEFNNKSFNSDLFIFLISNFNLMMSEQKNHKYHLPVIFSILNSIMNESNMTGELISEFTSDPIKILIVAEETLIRSEKSMKILNRPLPCAAKDNNSLIICMTLISCVLKSINTIKDIELMSKLDDCVPLLDTISEHHPCETTRAISNDLRVAIVTKKVVDKVSLKSLKEISTKLNNDANSNSDTSSDAKASVVKVLGERAPCTASQSTENRADINSNKKKKKKNNKKKNKKNKKSKKILIEMISDKEDTDEDSNNSDKENVVVRVKKRIDNPPVDDEDITPAENFEDAMKLVKCPEIPFIAHGIMALIKLLEDLDVETCQNKHNIFLIFKENLVHTDSYIYLQAINGLRALSFFIPSKVMDLALSEIRRTKNDISSKVMLRWSELLMQLTKTTALLPYKEEILNTLLMTIQHTTNELTRCSAISVLSDICRELNFAIYSHQQEIFDMIEKSLSPNSDQQVAKSAAHFLSILFSEIDTEAFLSISPKLIWSIYNHLQTLMYANGLDSGIVKHCEYAMSEISNNAISIFRPNETLEKKIGILSL